MRYPTSFIGIPVDDVSMSEALQTLEYLVDRGRIDRRPAYVATCNVDYFVKLYRWWCQTPRSPQLLQVLRQADLVTADGMPLLWFSRLTGTRIKERVAGATLLPLFAERCSQREFSLFLLGGAASTAAQAANNLVAAYPGLKIVGIKTPEISFNDEDHFQQVELDRRLLHILAETKPDVLILSLGCPKQELWFQRVREHLRVPLSIGVGGSLKFLAGHVKRAPYWMQKMGLEWLYRWSQEPYALTSRYVHNLIEFPFLVAPLILDGVFSKMKIGQIAAEQSDFFICDTVCGNSNYVVYRLPTGMTANSLAKVSIPSLANNTLVPIIDFRDVQALDADGLGFLFAIGRHHQVARLMSIGISPSIEKKLVRLRARDYFCSAPTELAGCWSRP